MRWGDASASAFTSRSSVEVVSREAMDHGICRCSTMDSSRRCRRTMSMSVLDMFSLTAICAVASAIRLEDALITVGSIPLDDTGLPVSPRLCCDVVHLSACTNACSKEIRKSP